VANVVTCRHLENYQVQVSSQSHSWIADESEGLGGDDLGPDPFDQLLGALGSCMLITVYHYVAQQSIPVTRLSATIEGEWQEEGDDKTYVVDVVVKLAGDLSDHDVERVKRATKRCPVHKILSEAAEVRAQVEVL